MQPSEKPGNPLDHDPALKEYFNALPPFVQESIKQCGVEVGSIEELKACAENLMQGK